MPSLSQRKAIADFKKDWDPKQYKGDGTYATLMRGIAEHKVALSDKDIIDELEFIDK